MLAAQIHITHPQEQRPRLGNNYFIPITREVWIVKDLVPEGASRYGTIAKRGSSRHTNGNAWNSLHRALTPMEVLDFF